jgi:choline-glycine betaine transporter
VARRRRLTSAAPWWRIATLTLLLVALGLAISSGRTIEAVIIGLLMIPSLVLVGAWALEKLRKA